MLNRSSYKDNRYKLASLETAVPLLKGERSYAIKASIDSSLMYSDSKMQTVESWSRTRGPQGD